VPSDVVPFDQRPWMKAAEITDAVIAEVRKGERKFIRLNYPNGDMVGHTGIVSSVLIAMAAVDICLGRLLPEIEKARGVLMVTADHGNADQMFTEKNGVRTPMVAHTLNPVPFLVKDFSGANAWQTAGVQGPKLSNVAATICTLLGLMPPADYDAPLIRLGSKR
jgi:2,3-bisphosphoglycerate-independent phosphoglycerate mutase